MKIKRRRKSIAQVILEVAIVLVCLALLGIAAMRLFSNVNLNLLERVKLYKSTQRAAVNTVSPVAPSDFLNYSPHCNILIPDSAIGSFSGLCADPGINVANALLERSNDIVSFIIPSKVYYVYGILNLDPNTVAKSEIEKARDETYNTINLAKEAWDKFNQASAAFDDVHTSPKSGGPFDPEVIDVNQDGKKEHPEIERNRKSLESIIESLNSAKSGLDGLINQQLLPRLEDSRLLRRPVFLMSTTNNCEFEYNCRPCRPATRFGPCDSNCHSRARFGWNLYYGAYPSLKGAIECWDSIKCGDECCGFTYGCRETRIKQAKALFKEIVDFVAAVKIDTSATIKAKLKEAYGLSQSDSYEVITQVKDLCGEILADPELDAATTLKGYVDQADNALRQAIFYWNTDPAQKDHYLELGRSKLEAINEAFP